MTKPTLQPDVSASIPARPTASKCKSASNIVKQSTKSAGTTSANTSVQAIDKRKRIAANARERKRMHLLNNAYDKLRKRLVDAENKSKYDVLVQAKEYIQALTSICENFDKQHPNQCSKMEPVQDSWPTTTSSGDEPQSPSEHSTQHCRQQQQQNQQQQQQQWVLDGTRAPGSPLSPSVTVKFELSPQSPITSVSSVMSPCSDEAPCLSPMSYSESVISCCSQPPQKVIHPLPTGTPASITQLGYLNHTNTQFYYHHHNQQQQQQVPPESLNSCSTLLSPPPSSNLSSPGIMHHDYTPSTFDSLLMPGRHHNHHYNPGAAQTLSNTHDIYHQYYQTFYHIQRAT